MRALFEGSGLVVPVAEEQLSAVVATATGGIPEVVDNGETGLLVHSHDPSDWADALARLLDDDPMRIAMGEAAVAHAARFSWASSAAALAEIYDEASRIKVPDCHQRRAIGD